MSNNINSGYWKLTAQSITPRWLGKTFYVSSVSWTNAQTLQNVFTPDYDWVTRVYSTITLALAACVTSRWDTVVISQDYTTAPTDAELTTAWTKWVRIIYATQQETDEQIAMTASKTLPASTTWALFNVVWLVEVIAIVWVVTTVIQTQACNLKLSTVSNSATTDICADLNISANAAQSRYSITWTFANTLINTAKWVPVARQATSFIAQEGTIIATTSATNTGAVRWAIRYKPLQEWARIYAA